MRCSPSGTDCSRVGPPWGHKLCQQACSRWGTVSTHPQVLAGSSSSTGLPMGSQLPSAVHLLRRGVPSTGYRWISAPPWTSMDCRGTSCLTMDFITSCKGRLSAPTFRAPLPPSFTDLGVCRIVSLTSSHSSLSSAVSPAEIFSALS